MAYLLGIGVLVIGDILGTGTLSTRSAWNNAAEYDSARIKLAQLFIENFKKYAEGLDPSIVEAGPRVTL